MPLRTGRARSCHEDRRALRVLYPSCQTLRVPDSGSTRRAARGAARIALARGRPRGRAAARAHAADMRARVAAGGDGRARRGRAPRRVPRLAAALDRLHSDAHEQAAAARRRDRGARRAEPRVASLAARGARPCSRGTRAPASRRLRARSGGRGDDRRSGRSCLEPSPPRTASGRAARGRLGVGGSAQRALATVFERWDGKGFPHGLAGEAIPLPVRFIAARLRRGAALAACAAPTARGRGPPAARGKLFDPAVVDALFDAAARRGARRGEPWDEVLALAPGSRRCSTATGSTRRCRAVGEFADLKSPSCSATRPRVAELAEAAAWRLRLDAPSRAAARGPLSTISAASACSSSVWDRPGPAAPADWDAVRLHPYHTERFLSRCAGARAARPARGRAPRAARRLAATTAARPPRSSRPAARVLAAADVYQAMTEPRPHRPGARAGGGGRELRARGARRAGSTATRSAPSSTPRAIAATASRRELPARALTEREVEVLRAARARAHEQADRRAARDRAEDRRPPRRARLREGRASPTRARRRPLFAMEHGLAADGAFARCRSPARPLA